MVMGQKPFVSHIWRGTFRNSSYFGVNRRGFNFVLTKIAIVYQNPYHVGTNECWVSKVGRDCENQSPV